MGTLLPKIQKLPYDKMKELSNNWANGPQAYRVKNNDTGNYDHYNEIGEPISEDEYNYYYPNGFFAGYQAESTNINGEATSRIENRNGKSNIQFNYNGTISNSFPDGSKRSYKTINNDEGVLTYDIDNPQFNNFQSEGTGRTLSVEELQNFLNKYNTKKSGGTLNRTKLIPRR